MKTGGVWPGVLTAAVWLGSKSQLQPDKMEAKTAPYAHRKTEAGSTPAALACLLKCSLIELCAPGPGTSKPFNQVCGMLAMLAA